MSICTYDIMMLRGEIPRDAMRLSRTRGRLVAERCRATDFEFPSGLIIIRSFTTSIFPSIITKSIARPSSTLARTVTQFEPMVQNVRWIYNLEDTPVFHALEHTVVH